MGFLQAYAVEMTNTDSRRVLWESVRSLMEHHYGAENLTRLAREASIGPGSASRIKAQSTSVGLELIDKIADLFDVRTWQLFVPGFDPKNPPTLLPADPAERAFIERMLSASRDLRARQP